MKRLVATSATFMLVAGIAAAAAQAKLGDPRKCVLNDAKACGAQAAQVALRRTVSARTGHPGTVTWTADITCAPTSAKYLVWKCSWKGGGGTYGTGAATVTFKALAGGWRSTVKITEI